MAQTTYDLTIKIGAKTNQSFKSTLNKAQVALSDLNSMSNVAMAGLTAATAGAATAAADRKSTRLNSSHPSSSRMPSSA